MKNILILVFFSCVFFSHGQSPYPNIQIAQPKGKLGPCEPSIAIDRTHPNHMIVGTVLNGIHYSNDSGKTWQSTVVKADKGVYGDPVVLSDDSGRFYFFHLSDPEGTNWKSEHILDRIVVQRSTNKGQSWDSESFTGLNRPKKQDKQWAVLSKKTQEIYCTWTEFDDYKSNLPKDKSRILFSKSQPGGMQWSTPVTISKFEGGCMDDNFTAEGAVPAAGENGEIFVAWARDEKIWFNQSFDGGKTWLEEEKAIANQIGGWRITIPGIPRANGFPITVVDNSVSPFKNSIYVLFSDARNGVNNQDIFIIHSRDSGKTWSGPARVNTDTSNRHQFLPWLTIDQETGHLYAVFYDRRNYSDNQTDVFLAKSTDGGVTWTDERISESPFVPFPDAFFGDYNHIDVINRVVRPVWTRYENGTTSVWTALLPLQNK